MLSFLKAGRVIDMSKKHPKNRLLSPAQLLGTNCETCLKKERVGMRYQCSVLTEFYFVGQKTPKDCWAFEDDQKRWAWQLKQLKNHLLGGGIDRPERTRTVKKVESDIQEVEGRKVSGIEARAMFFEESHKPGCGGAGEGQDRTHKLFPEARMKDNRYVPPWGSEGGTQDGGKRYTKKK